MLSQNFGKLSGQMSMDQLNSLQSNLDLHAQMAAFRESGAKLQGNRDLQLMSKVVMPPTGDLQNTHAQNIKILTAIGLNKHEGLGNAGSRMKSETNPRTRK